LGRHRQPGGLRLHTRSADVLTARSLTANITIPAAAQPGDFGILFDCGASVGIPSDVTPTNWTGFVSTTITGTTRLRVSRKILVAGDPNLSLTGINATDDRKILLVFRGTSPFHLSTVPTWGADAQTGNPSSQVVAAAGIACPVIVFGMVCDADGGGVAAFTANSPAFDGTLATTDGDMVVGWKIYNGGPVNHTIGMGDLGSANVLATGYVRLQ
jgi:hypothetical protein